MFAASVGRDHACETCQRAAADDSLRTPANRRFRFIPKCSLQIFQLPRIQKVSRLVNRRGEWKFVVTDDIVAVLCHQGKESLQSGHYFTYVRHPNNNSIWRCYNDSLVSDGPLPDSALCHVYLAMYDRGEASSSVADSAMVRCD